MKIAVKMYAEFGQDPQNITKLYPVRRNLQGQDFVPVYNIPFEYAVALYNCGKLCNKYAEQVRQVLTGELKMPSNELGGGEPTVVGKDTEQAADMAGSSKILSNFDTAGVNLQATKDGEAQISPILQGNEVEKAMNEIIDSEMMSE